MEIGNEFYEGGYYSTAISPNFRVLAINSNVFTVKKAHLEKIAFKQIEWITSELIKASLNKEQVIMIMHVPPGYSGYKYFG